MCIEFILSPTFRIFLFHRMKCGVEPDMCVCLEMSYMVSARRRLTKIKTVTYIHNYKTENQKVQEEVLSQVLVHRGVFSPRGVEINSLV